MEQSSAIHTVERMATVVREARKGQRLTQAQLALKAGVSRQFLIEIEAGHPRAEVGKVLSIFSALDLQPQVGHVTASVPYTPDFIVADSLDELHGPTSGEVTLPNRLLWNPAPPFDLSDNKSLRSMIRIVLREARSQEDLAEYVDRDSLVRLWGKLGLPTYIRAAWEQRFPELSDAEAQ